jgi:hypothetical protein
LNQNKKIIIAGLALVIAISAVAATPARGVLTRLIARIVPSLANSGARPANSATPVSISTAPALDVEQRARAAHGWTASVANSVARGEIIYYDSAGRATGQYAITISRAYPDRVRVEIDRGQTKDVSGFDQTNSWRSGAPNLKDTDARDIRALVRLCPERLFVERASGAAYREAGQRIEDIAPAATAPDWTTASGDGSSVIGQQSLFDQVEVADPAATRSNPGDIRRVYYYVDAATSMVATARWLEPDNPRKSIDDGTASFTDIRVDLSDWRDAGGVKWPFRLVHATGGRVDFRIVLNEVIVNQSLADAVFQKPR